MSSRIGHIDTFLVFILSAQLSGSTAQTPLNELDASRFAPVHLQAGKDQYASHIIVPPPPLRITADEWGRLKNKNINPPCGGHDFLPYLIQVSDDGLVQEATLQPYVSWCNDRKSPSDAPAFIGQHLVEAQALLRRARFRPWVINGHRTPVIISSGVTIAPPERYGQFQPFPSPIVQSSVSITMQQMGCEGKCPAYRVTLNGAGIVEYEGLGFVAVEGKRTAQIDPKLVGDLIHQFDEARFFSALTEYRGAYDGGETLLRFTMNGKSHTVNDAQGLRVGLPTSVRDLEWSIYRAADVRRWVYGPD